MGTGRVCFGEGSDAMWAARRVATAEAQLERTARPCCGCMAAQPSCCAHDLRCSVTCVAKTAASAATPASNMKSFTTTQAA